MIALVCNYIRESQFSMQDLDTYVGYSDDTIMRSLSLEGLQFKIGQLSETHPRKVVDIGRTTATVSYAIPLNTSISHQGSSLPLQPELSQSTVKDTCVSVHLQMERTEVEFAEAVLVEATRAMSTITTLASSLLADPLNSHRRRTKQRNRERTPYRKMQMYTEVMCGYSKTQTPLFIDPRANTRRPPHNATIEPRGWWIYAISRVVCENEGLANLAGGKGSIIGKTATAKAWCHWLYRNDIQLRCLNPEFDVSHRLLEISLEVEIAFSFINIALSKDQGGQPIISLNLTDGVVLFASSSDLQQVKSVQQQQAADLQQASIPSSTKTPIKLFTWNFYLDRAALQFPDLLQPSMERGHTPSTALLMDNILIQDDEAINQVDVVAQSLIFRSDSSHIVSIYNIFDRISDLSSSYDFGKVLSVSFPFSLRINENLLSVSFQKTSLLRHGSASPLQR